MKKITKDAASDSQAQVLELTADLQRLRADFENYRKRVDSEKQMAKENGESAMIMKLLPVIDTIDRAVQHIPADIADHSWVKGISGVVKQLDSVMSAFDLKRIDAASNTIFNPEIHQAVQFDEDSVGDKEVVVEELQSGYTKGGKTIRPAMVKAARQ
jgi:molecular chaperone GrpE